MSDQTPDQNLHLPSLAIKNFRGIDELTIPRLGRVTLLTGKNGVGKTTVLDAVRIWAARANPYTVDSVLKERGDVNIEEFDPENPNSVPDRIALFTDRRESCEVVIGQISADDARTLRMTRTPAHEITPLRTLHQTVNTLEPVELNRKFGSARYERFAHDLQLEGVASWVPCYVFGPDGPSDETIERHWSDLALTSHEDRALDALNLLIGDNVERVAAVPTTDRIGRFRRRRFMAKIKGKDFPMPVRSLGAGALRALALALALAKSTDGFLLIDEAENGIHHSIQAKFWNMVLQTAERNNVQVIATTHSWDCVVGFAKAANELEDVEGVLYRIQRNGDRLRAVEYPETELANAAKHSIEVR